MPQTAEALARTAAKRDLFIWLPALAEMHSGPPAGQEEALKKGRVMSPGGRLNQASWLRFLLFCIHVATTQGQHGVNLYASDGTTADAFGTNPAQANRWLNLAEKLGVLVRESQPSPRATVVRRISLPKPPEPEREVVPTSPDGWSFMGGYQSGYQEPPF